MIRNFEIIGEASHNIETHYPEFATAHPELPLVFAYQMRNAVAHGCTGDDTDPNEASSAQLRHLRSGCAPGVGG